MKVLAIVMIFAFAALGGAYAALWKDTIVLKTTVKTGKVALKWANPDVGDDYHGNVSEDLKDAEDSVAATLNNSSANPNAGDNWGANPVHNQAPGIRRDVGHISLVGLSNNDKTLTVLIENAYPDYQGEIQAYVVNAGTIPVVINSITAKLDGNVITSTSPVQCNVMGIPDPWEGDPMSLTNPKLTPLLGTLLEASNSNGSRHDTGDPDAGWGHDVPNMKKVKISVHVAGATGMEVLQNHTYELQIDIDGTQWNGINNDNPAAPTPLDLPNTIVSRFD